jgi:4-hydroxythreonine-4-phosphate dehydrogenase
MTRVPMSVGTVAHDGASNALPARHPTPLALTMGDPAGIGLEITLKAWLQRSPAGLAPFCFYGSAAALQDRASSLGYDVATVSIDSPAEATHAFERALPVIDIGLAVPAIAGNPSSKNAPAIIAAIERAIADTRAGLVRGVVTNPIAKSVLTSAGFKHPGHTEYLAQLADMQWPGSQHHSVMMLACDALKVVPLTIHVPLADVPRLITFESIVTTARITARALASDFGIASPRVAVAGLNPHAGEAGTIGVEDRNIIAPAVAALAAEGLCISGPHSADTLFHEGARKTYDAVIAMYHDQALIPIKTLAFDEGVNVTLGLPFVRTSPDHGTAFDIAGKGIASPTSLIEALRLACTISNRRAKART